MGWVGLGCIGLTLNKIVYIGLGLDWRKIDPLLSDRGSLILSAGGSSCRTHLYKKIGQKPSPIDVSGRWTPTWTKLSSYLYVNLRRKIFHCVNCICCTRENNITFYENKRKEIYLWCGQMFKHTILCPDGSKYVHVIKIDT